MTIALHVGDCREVLATLPAASVQTCVTSPPYFGLRSYLTDEHTDKPNEIGLEQRPDCLGWATGEPCGTCYVCSLVTVFREVRRVLRDDGTVWLNLGDSYAANTKGSGGVGSSGLKRDGREENARLRCADLSLEQRRLTERKAAIPAGLKPKDLMMIPARVALALQANGWWLRSEIIFSKAAPMPESVTDRPTCAHEKVWLLTKRADYYYDAEAVAEPAVYDGPPKPGRQAAITSTGGKATMALGQSSATRNLRNVWHLNPEPSGIAHYAMMPTKLAERCIKAGTSEKGCCPGCGAPWVRVVERGLADHGRGLTESKHMKMATTQNGGVSRRVRIPSGQTLAKYASHHIGWSPSCPCPSHDPIPCTVLDPFAGGGTTLLVADRLQRHGLGIELNEAYARIARSRVHDDAPLLMEATSSTPIV